MGLLLAALLAVCAVVFFAGRWRTEEVANPESDASSDEQVFPFQVHWPLSVGEMTNSDSRRPLLLGELRVREEQGSRGASRLRLRVELIRRDDESSRQFWNDCLEYRQYAWMRRVRVWDEAQRWLYPNLAYLFKLHGVDRVQRYGGWDPGHQVDNDFGAILIRKFDVAGENELPATAAHPLVSATWEPVGISSWDRQTVVHRIQSDEFGVKLTPDDRGRLKVWFVYADFMEHQPPLDWPEQPEFNGGTIAFFQVDWRLREGKTMEITVKQDTPPTTGFDWQAWVGRREKSARTRGEARLSENGGT